MSLCSPGHLRGIQGRGGGGEEGALGGLLPSLLQPGLTQSLWSAAPHLWATLHVPSRVLRPQAWALEAPGAVPRQGGDPCFVLTVSDCGNRDWVPSCMGKGRLPAPSLLPASFLEGSKYW